MFTSNDESFDDSPRKAIKPIDGFYWRKNEPFNHPVPPSIAELFLKDKQSDPQSRYGDSYILESLRCGCGYSPYVQYPKTIYPGAAYYVCGALHNRCNFYIWHKDLLNDRFRKCKCGLPVVKDKLTKVNDTYYYTCVALMFKDKCNYCAEVTRFNGRNVKQKKTNQNTFG